MKDNHSILTEEAESIPESSRVKYFDIVLERGSGALLYDVEGREYIDFLSSASSANVGHCHPKVVKAIQEQAERLIHFTPAYYANEMTASLLTKLAQLAPGNFSKKVALGTSGSDANDAIIKFSRAYTGRPYIISFTGAYHGSTYGSLSLSSVSLNMSRKIGPLLPNIIKLPYPDTHLRMENETDDQFIDRMWQMFTLPFETWLPVEEVAAIIIEPIQGDGGIIAAPKDYLKRLYDFTRKHGIIFAVDEINQGLGRSGKMWSVEHFNIEPDLISVGKSLASGLPLSALIGRTEIMDSLAAPAHVFTTAGNPICAAAAHATLEVIEEEKLVKRSEQLGKQSFEFFQTMKEKYDFIGDTRMYGLDGGIDIVDSNGSPDIDGTTKIIYKLFQLGVIMISLRGNILRFQPPLVITEAQLNKGFKQIEIAFEAYKNNELTLPEHSEKIGW
ncbi:aspartate aminotransferase family protein [Lactococcus allomyrinae]|uniref:Aspartate aminotransferase family protein n=1 Tax=Lactococcus allomyrinae TaxID=2419773 RepID=A0A387BDJ5_9LACT|nr:aspartate aminotransferase family protein [Lactococcus allomyrinae]AYG00132.1 aspartate aminotransferase family protein [Lactococcus allomyrinae]